MPDLDDSCMVLLLDCLVGVVAGIGVIVYLWRLQYPLRVAERCHRQVSGKLYKGLAIYVFLRRYVLVMQFAGFVALLVSAIGLVESLVGLGDGNACKPTGHVASLILVLFGVHMSTIACFETGKHHDPVPAAKGSVENVGKRLWGVAAILLVTTGLLFGLAKGM